ncbi:MAG: hypothetical protein HY691_16985 [Chloroflexi bacterium]|nr:hypothetical protein [Chloroflexota bacterium]
MRLSAGLLSVLVAVALLAPSVAPYDPRHSTGRPLEAPSRSANAPAVDRKQ